METVIDQIGEAIVATGKIVDGVEDSQWSCSTPCEDWDARALTNHFVGGLRMFAAAITGTEAAGDFSTDWLGADPKAAYYAAAREATAAWHSPGALDKTIELSFGPVPGQLAAVIHLTEIFVHGLDLAVATGQESRVDQEMSQRLLAMMKQAGTIDTFRVPEIFEPEVVPADDAPAHRKLLSFLGRKGVAPSSRSTATSVSFPARGKRRGTFGPAVQDGLASRLVMHPYTKPMTNVPISEATALEGAPETSARLVPRSCGDAGPALAVAE